jgi:hypothetical protein
MGRIREIRIQSSFDPSFSLHHPTSSIFPPTSNILHPSPNTTNSFPLCDSGHKYSDLIEVTLDITKKSQKLNSCIGKFNP